MPTRPWRWSNDCSLYAFGLPLAMLVPPPGWFPLRRVQTACRRLPLGSGEPLPELVATDPEGGVVGTAIHAAYLVGARMAHDVPAEAAAHGQAPGRHPGAHRPHRESGAWAGERAPPAVD